jgi:hypothetical protein
VLRSRERLEVGFDEFEHQGYQEWTMHKQVAVAFDVASVFWVEMNGVGIECEGGVAEEESPSGCEGVRELRLARCCNASVNVFY